ncbi:MAG TPA: DHA2 family efflux MFS transporter permease subunit [Caulobacteraceae bacterium]
MTDAATIAAPPHAPGHGDVDWGKLFLGFGGMVIGQFMAILDIQIVAASLSQIQAGVGASADEISWVQTIYLLAEVVIMPLTAYLTRLFGTRSTFVACCAGFIVSSVATGFSTSIEVMILLRAVQGLAAGAMIPAVFATAFTAFPPERRITANVIVGLIVTLAPTIGPTLGGHITEALSWRWLFFINVPPGLLAIFLVSRWGAFDKGDPSLAKGVDWIGVFTLAVSLLSIQYVLEEGAGERWFQSGLILWLAVIGVLSGIAFVWRQLTYRQPLLNLEPFRDRNFTLGMVMTFVSGLSLFGGTFLLPLYLAQILHYSAAEVGTTMLVSGLTMFMTGPLAGRLVRQMDPRLPMFLGFALAAYGIGLGARVNEDWGFWNFAWLQALRGVGTMIAMIASQTLTVSTIPPRLMKDASALVNVTRNVGGAVGLALITTILGYQAAVHYNDLASAMSIDNQTASGMLQGFSHMMTSPGVIDPAAAGRKALGGFLHQKALMLAFGDAFFWLAAGCAVAAVLGLLGKPGKMTAFGGGGGGH